jgi:hypothetical protein
MILLLVIVACGFFNADAAKPKPLFCNLTEAEIAGLSGDASTDIKAVSHYSKTAYGLMQAGKFEQLDCLAESVRSRKETFPGGMWKIHAIYMDLVRPPLHQTKEDWVAHIGLVQRWVTTRPESITARIALAESYVSYGWDFRGGRYAETGSDAGWEMHIEHTAKAKQVLEEASTLSAKDPEWYVAMQYVALAQGWEASANQALLERAIKFEPTYYYYYRMYASSITRPMSGGEEGEVGKILGKVANSIGGDAGDILYFRVAGNEICGCEDDRKLGLSWPRIQRGFTVVEKQYGSSLENWNQLAHMATSFNDPVVANRMLIQIKDRWSEDIWQVSSYYESTKQWAERYAKEMEPYMAAKQAAEQSAETNLLTPFGHGYKSAFDEKINAWMQPCKEELKGSDLGEFELLIEIGKEGTIEYITGGGNSPIMACLGPKLNEFRMAKQAVFPAPPQPDYWVQFDLNPEATASAELK